MKASAVCSIAVPIPRRCRAKRLLGVPPKAIKITAPERSDFKREIETHAPNMRSRSPGAAFSPHMRQDARA